MCKIKEICDNLYCIQVPLASKTLGFLNAYCIRGERSLLIDTGYDMDLCEHALLKALHDLDIDRRKLDIAITHFHPDHSGLLERILLPETVVYAREYSPPATVDCGALPFEFNQIPLNMPQVYCTMPTDQANRFYKADGDLIHCEDFILECIETPGHHRSHLCYYDKTHKLLFSGDHVLERVSPAIFDIQLEDRSLQHYSLSLRKVRNLDAQITLPGHGPMITDLQTRVDTLLQHHENRLMQTMQCLSECEQDILSVAKKLIWNGSPDWNKLTRTTRYFAWGETFSYLNELTSWGVAIRKKHDDSWYYRLA